MSRRVLFVALVALLGIQLGECSPAATVHAAIGALQEKVVTSLPPFASP